MLIEAGFEDKAKRIASCGHFKNVAQCTQCGQWHFNGAETCKDRFCPVCQKKRALLWFAKVTPIMREYIEKNYYVNMLNFTIRDMHSLKDAISILNKAFRYLTHDNKEVAKEFNKRFIGGIRSLEVITGKNSGLWHPHYHCIVVKSKYSEDFKWLAYHWNNALCVVTGKYGQKLGSIDVRGFIHEDSKGLETAVCETFKYMTKFNWKVIDLSELIITMSNRMSIFTWGCIRHKLGKYNPDTELDLNYTDIQDRICRVCGNDTFDLIEHVGADYLDLADFVDPSDYYTEIFNKYERK